MPGCKNMKDYIEKYALKFILIIIFSFSNKVNLFSFSFIIISIVKIERKMDLAIYFKH